MTIELILPYPPSVNHYKRVGRFIRTKKGKLYQSRVNTEVTTRFYYEVWCCVRVMNLESLQKAPISLEMDIYPPDRRKRDIDNGIKPTLDALQKAHLYDDDNQICRLLVQRCSIVPGGQVIVRISEIK